MKQHIAIEQLTELSPGARNKLKDWWTPQDGDLVVYWGGRWKKFYGPQVVELHHDCGSYECCGYDFEKDKNSYPLLSIGQMIEFLADSDYLLNITQGQLSHQYYVWDRRREKGDQAELCDALWQAVKQVLIKTFK